MNECHGSNDFGRMRANLALLLTRTAMLIELICGMPVYVTASEADRKSELGEIRSARTWPNTPHLMAVDGLQWSGCRLLHNIATRVFLFLRSFLFFLSWCGGKSPYSSLVGAIPLPAAQGSAHEGRRCCCMVRRRPGYEELGYLTLPPAEAMTSKCGRMPFALII